MAEHEGHYLLMTPNISDWNTHTTSFRDQELNMMDYNDNVREEKRKQNMLFHEIMELIAEDIEISSIENVTDTSQFVRSVKPMDKLTSGFSMISVVSRKRRKKTTAKKLETGNPASNRAERAIKILKDGSKNDIFDSDCTVPLWCYCVERRAKIINLTV